jgi:hypothetical protein
MTTGVKAARRTLVKLTPGRDQVTAALVYPQTANEKLIELQFSQKKNTQFFVCSEISSVFLITGRNKRRSHEGASINDVTTF